MKHVVRRIKSLAVALKELEPYIRNGAHPKSGKPFKAFGRLRSRELLANWLLCAIMTVASSSPPTPQAAMASSSTATDRSWLTEHVMVAEVEAERDRPVDDRILDQVGDNVEGGAAYARGKTLLVFNNANGGAWYPNRVAHALPDPLHFDTVWVMGLQGVVDGAYVYGVCNLSQDAATDSPSLRVTLAPGFDGWSVERMQ